MSDTQGLLSVLGRDYGNMSHSETMALMQKRVLWVKIKDIQWSLLQSVQLVEQELFSSNTFRMLL